MVVVFQMGFVKTNQKQIVEITRFGFKLRDDRDLQLSLSGELVAQ